MRVLLVASEAMLPIDIEDEIADVQRRCLAVGVEGVRVTDSHAWFKETFPRHRDLQTWVHQTINGLDFTRHEPHFDVFYYPLRFMVDMHGAMLGAEARRQGRVMLTPAAQGVAFDRVDGFIASMGEDGEGTWRIKVLEAS